MKIFKNLQNPAKKLPGLRNIKTCVAILIALILYEVLNKTGVTFALITILICMQGSVEKSLEESKSRIVGAILGACFGTIFLFFSLYFHNVVLFYTFCIFGLMMLIHLFYIFGLQKSIVIAATVYLSIFLNVSSDVYLILYSASRALDIVLGIVIALCVNRFLYKPKDIVK